MRLIKFKQKKTFKSTTVRRAFVPGKSTTYKSNLFFQIVEFITVGYFFSTSSSLQFLDVKLAIKEKTQSALEPPRPLNFELTRETDIEVFKNLPKNNSLAQTCQQQQTFGSFAKTLKNIAIPHDSPEGGKLLFT